jgi:protein-S-isoprenylcysteine O-methyltransferase Ste14
MPDELGAVWRNQPEEKNEMNLQHFVNRRTREIHSSTRSEILMSVTAALFFIAVMAWRFAPALDRLLQFGFVVVIAWVLVSLYWFRDRIWQDPPRPDAVAATSLEYYRKELERRRDHLRNAWLWNGPVFLAFMIFVVTLLGKAFSGPARLRSVLPLLVLLAVWTALGFGRRRQQARELQREIDEIELG